MNEHAFARCLGEADVRNDGMQRRAPWHWLLLVCAAVAMIVCNALPSGAINGEPVGGEGLFRAGTCNSDFTISCDDRSATGIVSCHMRGAKGDEGLAVNACVDGRITVGIAQSQFLETDTAINTTDFGEFVCGKDSNSKNFCIVCDTFVDPEAGGASHCVKITNDSLGTSDPGGPTCGAFTVSTDNGALCAAQTQSLKQFFSSPSLGFSIGFNASDASQPAAKDLLVCSGRSWQCLDSRPDDPNPLATASQVQQQQTHGLIDTPCCMKLSSGAYYCSTKLVTSATCR
jgi:hypothetical protein